MPTNQQCNKWVASGPRLGMGRAIAVEAAASVLVLVALHGCSDDAADAMQTAGSANVEPDAGGEAGAAGDTGMDAGDDGQVGFADDVYPILIANCAGISCHGDESFLPQHANSDVNVAFEEASAVAELIAGRVAGELTPIMPQFCGPGPGQGDCLSFEQVTLIRTWVDQGARF